MEMCIQGKAMKEEVIGNREIFFPCFLVLLIANLEIGFWITMTENGE